MFQGLKTGMYYLRTKPAAQAIQFTVDKTKLRQKQGTGAQGKGSDAKANGAESAKEQNMAAMVCSLANKEECMMCSG